MASPINMMTLHKYVPGKLQVAFAAITTEAEKVAADGYMLLHYQVLESERCITTLYKRTARRPQAGTGSSLVGE